MAIRRKHFKLDRRKIDRARRALDARTERETLDWALDMVLAEKTPGLRPQQEAAGAGEGKSRTSRKAAVFLA